MAGPRDLPEDDQELERLIRTYGLTAVARLFGVTRSAVSAAATDRGLDVARRPDHAAFIPWQIQHPDDRQHHIARMLRAYGKARSGAELTERERLGLVQFLRMLDEQDTVVDYCPDDRDEPFQLVRRLPSDTGYVRRRPEMA